MYTEKEKELYILPHSNVGLDPLEVRRNLILETEGKLQELINEFNSTAKALSEEQTAENEFAAAKVEQKLITATRIAMSLDNTQNGGVTDAVVLEYLAHFLEWLSMPYVAKPKPSQKSRPCTGCP